MKTNAFKTFIKGLALILTLITAFTVVLTGCEFREETPDSGENDAGEEEVEYYKKTFKELADVEYDPLDYIKLPAPSEVVLHKRVVDRIVDFSTANILIAKAENETFKEAGSATVKLFDTANITFTGRVKDESIEVSEDTLKGMDNSSSASGSDLVIGSGSFIGEYISDDETKQNDGFEEQLIGMSVGETKDITVTFPDNYGNSEELQGVVVIFSVKINSIKRPKLDTFEPTDEQCKEYTEGEYETAEAMRSFLEKYYTEQYAYELFYEKIEILGQCKEIVDIYFDQYIHENLVYTKGEKLTQAEYDAAYAELAVSLKDNANKVAIDMANEYVINQYVPEFFSVTLTEEEFNERVTEIWEENKDYYKYYGINTPEDFVESFGREYLENAFKTEKVMTEVAKVISIVE